VEIKMSVAITIFVMNFDINNSKLN